jgi:hypothetical protein
LIPWIQRFIFIIFIAKGGGKINLWNQGNDLTDHLPNFLIINKFTTLPKHFKMYKRDYSNYDECKLINDIEIIDWHVELPETNYVNTIFGSFYSKLSNIINKHIPLKLISRKNIKHMLKPWITGAIRFSLNVKNKLYKRYITTRTSYAHNKFKIYRNKLKRLIQISKKQYYSEYFRSNMRSMKNIWKGTKQIISSINPQAVVLPQRLFKMVVN